MQKLLKLGGNHTSHTSGPTASKGHAMGRVPGVSAARPIPQTIQRLPPQLGCTEGGCTPVFWPKCQAAVGYNQQQELAAGEKSVFFFLVQTKMSWRTLLTTIWYSRPPLGTKVQSFLVLR